MDGEKLKLSGGRVFLLPCVTSVHGGTERPPLSALGSSLNGGVAVRGLPRFSAVLYSLDLLLMGIRVESQEAADDLLWPRRRLGR